MTTEPATTAAIALSIVAKRSIAERGGQDTRPRKPNPHSHSWPYLIIHARGFGIDAVSGRQRLSSAAAGEEKVSSEPPEATPGFVVSVYLSLATISLVKVLTWLMYRY